MAEMNPSTNEIKKKIWSIQTVPKMKAFIWKAVSDAIPVVDLTAKRGISIDTRCQICGQEGESVNHVLFSCSLARQIWAMSCFPCPAGGFDIHYLLRSSKCSLIPLDIRRLFPWLLWFMWKNRNDLFFEGKVYLATEVVIKAREEADQWFLSQSLDKTTVTGTRQKQKVT